MSTSSPRAIAASAGIPLTQLGIPIPVLAACGTPPAGYAFVWRSSVDGKLKVTKSTGTTVNLEADPPGWSVRSHFANCVPANAPPNAAGCVVTARGTASDGTVAGTAFTTYTTTASANQSAGWWIVATGSTPLFARQHTPREKCLIRTPADITNFRIWISFSNSEDPTLDTGTTHHAGVRYSSVAGDTQFMLSCKDGTTQATPLASGVTVTGGTNYTIEWWLDSGGLNVSFNDAAAVVLNSNLPGNTTALGVLVMGATTAASARSFSVSRCAGYAP